jgi:HEAT repeat protein
MKKLVISALCGGWLILPSPISAQTDPPPWVGRAARLAMSELNTDAGAIVAALDDEHWFVRARAVQAAGQFKLAAAVPKLVERFPNETWDAQARIVRALADIGDPRGIPVVLSALESQEGAVRLTATRALASFRDARTTEAVRTRVAAECSADEKLALVRAVRTLNLAAVADNLKRWRGADAALDREIAVTLQALGDADAGAFVAQNFFQLPNSTRADVIARWKTAPDARAVPVLVKLLKDGDVAERRDAAATLETFRADLPVEPLANALADPDEETRAAAARALAYAPEAEVVALLSNRLKADPPVALRNAIIAALAPFDREKVIPALIAVRLDKEDRPIPGVAVALEKLGVAADALNATLADATLPAARRIEAALRLGQLGEPDALDKLVRLKTGGDVATRRAVAAALGSLGDLRAVEPLIVTLDDTDPSVRAEAAAGLKKLGFTAEKLAADLTAAPAPARVEALRLLAKLGGSGQTPTVIAQLQSREPAVRGAAANAIGEFKGPGAADALIPILRDPDAAVRLQAAAALGRIGDAKASDALAAALRGNDAALATEAAASLAKLNERKAVPALLDALKSPNWAVRAQVARTLGELGDERAAPVLAVALDDASAVVRFYARRALERFPNAPTADLLDLFNQPNRRGWFSGREVLKALKPEAVVETLITRLDDPQPMNRALAASLLGSLHDDRALVPLVKHLENEDRFQARWWLAWAIGQFGEAAVAPLSKCSKAKLSRLRADAIRARGWLSPNEENRAAIRAGLTDPEEQVRSAAVEALGRFGDADPLSRLLIRRAGDGGAPFKPDEVIDALLRCGPAGRSALLAAVPASDAGLKATLLQRLGEDGNPDVLPFLLTGLKDTSANVRLTAVRELARQSDERAVTALRAHAPNETAPEVRAAIEAVVSSQ